jgi:4-amino-4-deoxy-L-arabinose transferase-like glycosyltransferase
VYLHRKGRLLAGTIGSKRLLKAIWIFLFLGLGISLRFGALDSIPGLEHDEALICLGAQEIASGCSYPLTGDKVYEGPLMEYLLVCPVLLSCGKVWACRAVLALLGVLSLLILYLSGQKLGGTLTGLGVLCVTALNPWTLAASRVIYACNLSLIFIPVFLYCLHRYHVSQRWIWLSTTGLVIGLTMQGRFTAVLLIIPAILVVIRTVSRGRIRAFCTLLFPAAAGIFPVILYNILHDWPSVGVLFGRSQSHFISSSESFFQLYFHRFLALVKTLIHGLEGDRVWLDFPNPGWVWPGMITILFLLGLLRILFEKHLREHPVVQASILTFFIPLFSIPIVTKHLQMPSGDFLYHPHYLDLLVPPVMLITGFAFAWIYRLILQPRLRWLCLVLLTIAVSVTQGAAVYQIYQECRETGGPGRWHRGFESAAHLIRSEYTPETVSIVCDWTFGAGYPQLKFLLPGFQVTPYLGTYTGQFDTSSDRSASRVLTVSNMADRQNSGWKALTHFGVPYENPLKLFSLVSPGVNINGILQDGNADGTRISISSTSGSTILDAAWTGIMTPPDQEPIPMTIHNRSDSYCFNDAILNLSDKVTPRHRSEIDLISRYLCCVDLTGTSGQNLPVVLHWYLRNSHWTCEAQINDLRFHGIFSGTVTFY